MDSTQVFQSLADTNLKASEVITQTQLFYQMAWNQLLWLVGVLGGLLVIAVSVVIAILQHYQIRMRTEKVSEDLKRKLTEVIEVNEKKLIGELEKLREQNHKDLDLLQQESSNHMYTLLTSSHLSMAINETNDKQKFSHLYMALLLSVGSSNVSLQEKIVFQMDLIEKELLIISKDHIIDLFNKSDNQSLIIRNFIEKLESLN